MKGILYSISRKFWLTRNLTGKIEERISILYPSTKYSVINRTAEALFKIYLAAVLVMFGLFVSADFSVYYSVIAGITVYAVMNAKIYGELEKLELKLLLQFEQFVSDVKFRFQFDGMLEEAILEAVNQADYEMSIHGEKILEYLKLDYVKDENEYQEIAPNHYFLTFYLICLMTLKYGDKKLEHQSMFVKNLGYLKEDINTEYLKRRKIRVQFMGLSGLAIIPVFAIKPIEKWAVSNMEELGSLYFGFFGILTTIGLALFAILVYQTIQMLRRNEYRETYRNAWIQKLAGQERINHFLLFYIAHFQKSCIKLDRLLRDVVYPYRLTEFLLMCWLMGVFAFAGTVILAISIGAPLWGVLMAGILGGFLGSHLLFWKLQIQRQILIMEREEEIVRFQTIILMIMHIDCITVSEILEMMEQFAVTFKEQIYELGNNFSYKGMDTFREAKGVIRFLPYEKLLDSFLACDIMPVSLAFADMEADRRYYVEKHKQDNEEVIEQKALIAKTISFLPLCSIIIIKLIVPFVVYGIGQLGSNMMMY